MARPCRALADPSPSGSTQGKQGIGHSGALYAILLALNILLIALLYFGIWRFLCKKKQQVGETEASTTAPSSPDAYPRNNRLEPRVLSSLPIFVYSIGGEEKTECAVCLMEFKEGEEGRVLPSCDHRFHTECVDMWFRSHSTCPLCRASIEHGAPDSSEAA